MPARNIFVHTRKLILHFLSSWHIQCACRPNIIGIVHGVSGRNKKFGIGRYIKCIMHTLCSRNILFDTGKYIVYVVPRWYI